MNYKKIQEILESEVRFQAQASIRNTPVTGRGGVEEMYSSLTIAVAQRLQAVGAAEKGNNKVAVLAIAMKVVENGTAAAIAAISPLAKPKPVIAEEPVKVKAVPGPLQAKERPQPKPAVPETADRQEIIRFQSAVAISQLLAAVYQLMEADTWTGHERRKELLSDLLDQYETVSKQHVNLSVKQLLRAKEGQNQG